LLKHRNDFRFSFQPVEISVQENGETVVRDAPAGEELCRTEAVEDAPRGTFRGSIETVRLRNLSDTVLCILAPDGVVAVLDCRSGDWNTPRLRKHLGDFPSALSAEGAMHAFANYHTLVGDRHGIREMVEDYERQATGGVDLLYPQLICHQWPMQRRQQMIGSIREQGLGTLFADEQALRRIARISLLAGVGADTDAVARDLDTTADALRAEIRSINADAVRKGFFEPFELSGNSLSSRV
jgi:hypothetical protein